MKLKLLPTTLLFLLAVSYASVFAQNQLDGCPTEPYYVDVTNGPVTVTSADIAAIWTVTLPNPEPTCFGFESDSSVTVSSDGEVATLSFEWFYLCDGFEIIDTCYVEVVGQGDTPEDICKIEDEQIGQVGAILVYNGVVITFTEWIPKDGEPNEYVGFTFEATGPVEYKVKAGQDVFIDNTTTWINPNGTGGPQVKGISHIDVCPPFDAPSLDDDENEKGKGKGKGKKNKSPELFASSSSIGPATELEVFPNPTADMTNIKLWLPSTSNINIDLYNLHGQLVQAVAKGEYGNGQHQFTMDVSNLSPGFYFVRLTTNTDDLTKRIIIE